MFCAVLGLFFLSAGRLVYVCSVFERTHPCRMRCKNYGLGDAAVDMFFRGEMAARMDARRRNDSEDMKMIVGVF